MRTVVVRHEGFCETKINDEIGLPHEGSYSIADYLHDVEEYDGRKLIGQCGGAYAFSDNTVELLTERKEAIELNLLDEITRAAVLRLQWESLPQLTRARGALVC